MDHVFATQDLTDRHDTLRRIVLALTLLGIVGLIPELILLKHYDKKLQFIPLILLGLGAITVGIVSFRPAARPIRMMQIVMGAFVIAGPLGIWLHYSGNADWVLERRPDAHGSYLFWKSLRGAAPFLAPGAMAQLGLLGLAYTFRHPALSRREHVPSTQERS